MPASRRTIFLAGLLLALAGLAVYAPSFSAPFVFDDHYAIADNPSIRHWSTSFSPPNEHVAGVIGRPFVNFTLAVNYALGGFDPWGYHVVNLFIHLLAAWTLLGVARRTLLLPRLRERFGVQALPLAFVIALLWIVHPLQTETVTCVTQRNESLGSLFYLLVFYGFIRSVGSPRRMWWQRGAVAACLLGVASKEIVATAPLLLLLYDRTFVAGAFRDAWKARRVFYGWLAATWALLAGLMLGANQRGGSVGFGLGMTWWAYGLKQGEAVVHYLWLAFWPHPLVLDYGVDVIMSPLAVWPQLLLLALLLAATLWALARRPALGFLGAWFFVILAPSSSIVPLTSQTMAEHRMYLPLAAVLTLAVLGLWSLLGRRSWPAVLSLTLALGGLTFERNFEYRREESVLADIVWQRPENPRGIFSFGAVLLKYGRLEEARQQFTMVLQREPGFSPARVNLGSALTKLGKPAEGLAQIQLGLQGDPDNWAGNDSLGVALAGLGRWNEAIAVFRNVLSHVPDDAIAHYNLAGALLKSGNGPAALAEYQTALRLNPGDAEMRNGYGFALGRTGDVSGAIKLYREALRLDPNLAAAHFNLGTVALRQGDLTEALAEFNLAVRLQPVYPDAYSNLGLAYLRSGRAEEAMVYFDKAVRLKPDFAMAHYNRGLTLAQIGRLTEAVSAFETALRYNPSLADARLALQQLQSPAGR